MVSSHLDSLMSVIEAESIFIYKGSEMVVVVHAFSDHRALVTPVDALDVVLYA